MKLSRAPSTTATCRGYRGDGRTPYDSASETRIMKPISIPLADAAATARLGEALAPVLRAGDIVCLSGPLGAGKTTLARGLIAAATGEKEAPSPTFALVETYEGAAAPISHFDLYRLEKPDDAWELGLEDAFDNAISIIEWPERIEQIIPADALIIRLDHHGGARHAVIVGAGAWEARLAAAGISALAEGSKKDAE